MRNTALESILTAERSWIASQPEFHESWDAGRNWFESFLVDCEHSYAAFYSGEEMVESCREKLSIALIYHWRNALVKATGAAGPLDVVLSGRRVVQSVKAGIRPTADRDAENDPKLMGGDPFRDVVLAVGTVRKSEPAFVQFHSEYRTDFEQLAKRLRLRDSATGDWEDLVLRLVTPRSPGLAPLSLYAGYTSLRFWLRPVAHNFLNDLRRHLKARRNAERRLYERGPEHATIDQASDNRAAEAGFDALRNAILDAFSRLDDRTKEILFRQHELGESNFEIARHFDVSEGHASRLRQQAHADLKSSLNQILLDTDFLSDHPTAAELCREVVADLAPELLGTLVRRHAGGD